MGGALTYERGYGDVLSWRPPFHASPVVHKGPISSNSLSSKAPLLRKNGKFSLSSPQIWKFSVHKPPKLEIFSSQAPKFGNFQFKSPPFQRQLSVHKPPLQKSGPHTPTKKKLSAPPNIHWLNQKANNYLIIGLWKCTCAYRSANEHCVMKRLEDD